jgi:tRNA G37 N-methylase TrmD
VGELRTVWRVRVRGFHKSVQRVQLAVLDGGRWEVVDERDVVVSGVREWVDEGGILVAGRAGAVEMVDAGGRVVQEKTLFLVY